MTDSLKNIKIIIQVKQHIDELLLLNQYNVNPLIWKYLKDTYKEYNKLMNPPIGPTGQKYLSKETPNLFFENFLNFHKERHYCYLKYEENSLECIGIVFGRYMFVVKGNNLFQYIPCPKDVQQRDLKRALYDKIPHAPKIEIQPIVITHRYGPDEIQLAVTMGPIYMIITGENNGTLRSKSK